MEEAVSAADAAVIVVSGKAGVQVGTEKAWELCDKYNLPRMIYVTEMDVDDASFRQVVEDLTTRYGKKIAPHFQPTARTKNLSDISMLLKMQEEDIRRSGKEKSARFLITVNRILRF